MCRAVFVMALCVVSSVAWGQESRKDASAGDAMLAKYFQAETSKLSQQCLAEVESPEAWKAKRTEYRRQLLEMLGLDPLPQKTDLKVTVTKIVDHKVFTVKCLHYQSRPGLYVTGNLYVPKRIDRPLPAILYVCGHGRVRIDGIDYGSKVHYQHHPAWFARNGYVCLVIDTLQLGEIEGIHHGTYREGMWWWLNRGYTPAGVEAWNCVRAIDYLESLDEVVDGTRIGVTGRSGGGAYSWWIAAIDERIKCAVPVAGITDLENHVVDGCVEGHCDCMFMVNTYRWDYPMLGALVAPRPLLISNTDSDNIFPLDGVYRTYQKVKSVYTSLGAKNNVAFHITAGPHKDTQELRVHAFRWFNKHLKGDTDSFVLPAEKYFEPEQLKVFGNLPSDERNTKIQEHFVAAAIPETPTSQQAWYDQRAEWMETLGEKVFRGWPAEDTSLQMSNAFEVTVDGLVLKAIDFDSQEHVRLRLLLASNEHADTHASVKLHVLDESDWKETLAMLAPAFGVRIEADDTNELAFQRWARELRNSDSVMAYLAPRGVGPTAWNQSEKKQIQNRRRFYLLGQTRDGMQVYDVRRAVQVLNAHPSTNQLPITLLGNGVMAGIGLYASLFEPTVTELQLDQLPTTHRHGPIFLNVRRFLDVPQAIAMAITSKKVTLRGCEGIETGTSPRSNNSKQNSHSPGASPVVSQSLNGDATEFAYAQKVAELIGRSESLRLAQKTPAE